MKALKNQGAGKVDSTLNLVGISLDLLIEWLDFTAEYNIPENYKGDTEVDHVVPLASFDLKDPKKQRKATHWTNLQLLTMEDNRTKSDRMPTPEELKKHNKLVSKFKKLHNLP